MRWPGFTKSNRGLKRLHANFDPDELNEPQALSRHFDSEKLLAVARVEDFAEFDQVIFPVIRRRCKFGQS
jgi:hypothetical protein